MEQIILIIHALAALAIIALILIQQGKGADMGASFGAGASQTLFGSGGGGNVLTKATALFATVFFVTSFGLAIVAKERAALSGGVDLDLPAVVEVSKLPLEQPVGDIPEIDMTEGNTSAMPDGIDIPLPESEPQELNDPGIPK
ncbi:MAG: preprotein translocase subunit SecG [Spongiibacteraceae bacterium]|nr:preprotein translocase subunit SecG [Spongiibacteraceae bacterium]